MKIVRLMDRVNFILKDFMCRTYFLGGSVSLLSRIFGLNTLDILGLLFSIFTSGKF